MDYKIGDLVKVKGGYLRGAKPAIARIVELKPNWNRTFWYRLEFFDGRTSYENRYWDPQSFDLLNGLDHVRTRHGL